MDVKIETGPLAQSLRLRARKIADNAAGRLTTQLADGFRAHDATLDVYEAGDEVRVSARSLRRRWVEDPALRDRKGHMR